MLLHGKDSQTATNEIAPLAVKNFLRIFGQGIALCIVSQNPVFFFMTSVV